MADYFDTFGFRLEEECDPADPELKDVRALLADGEEVLIAFQTQPSRDDYYNNLSTQALFTTHRVIIQGNNLDHSGYDESTAEILSITYHKVNMWRRGIHKFPDGTSSISVQLWVNGVQVSLAFGKGVDTNRLERLIVNHVHS